MRNQLPRTYSFSLSGWGFWLGLLAVATTLAIVGWGWFIAALVALLVGLITLPILAIMGFRWWLRRSITSDSCPVCQFESQALEGSRFSCPNCGEPLYVADGEFQRQTPPGTVEVNFQEE